ncbi:MAG: class I SAM-dependent methyltransferase [Silicimonas sp.]|nr:class I SAM-dependent methyltransferase [Silicimonas sp.]
MADDPDLDGAYALQSPEEALRLYRDWAARYDAEFVAGTGYRLPYLVVERYLAAGGLAPALDIGCGTGAVGQALPGEILLDGLDFSPEMLAEARAKSRYRHLIEADLKAALPIADSTYAGLLSAGTFTHGHVGAEALPELIRILAPGGVAVLSIRDEIWEAMGFETAFAQAAAMGQITRPDRRTEAVYGSGDTAPEGHGSDRAYITTFRRL